ncbi:hypothetical protein SAMN05660473_04222, partial [Arthrobacter sp. 49Tsu3.1M3]
MPAGPGQGSPLPLKARWIRSQDLRPP